MPLKLKVWALGLTSGLLAGFGLFLITWWLILIEGSQAAPTFIGRVYLGYSVTPLGSLIGLVWAFADWFIGGVVFAWLYNLIAGVNRRPE